MQYCCLSADLLLLLLFVCCLLRVPVLPLFCFHFEFVLVVKIVGLVVLINRVILTLDLRIRI